MKSSPSKDKLPLILRFHRLMDAFAKSDDERDFYLDRKEGFLLFADLEKGTEELEGLEKELKKDPERFVLVPKMTFYEVKKFIEGFVQEKVYDIDTKEKLIEIISAKEPRENFLEFIYDNLSELEKWQQYHQERSRIRIIEWLRSQDIYFVFEEDLEMGKPLLEKVKRTLFDKKFLKDIASARDMIVAKSKTYYSNEALNPRPKRGRPPKQVIKTEIEPQLTVDIYTQVPSPCRQFLYIPDISSASSVTFSAKFESEEHLLSSLKGSPRHYVDEKLAALSQRLESLQQITSRFGGKEIPSLRDFTRPLPSLTVPSKSPSGNPFFENNSGKVSSAIEDVLPKKKRGRPKKEEHAEEFEPQKRRRFAVKKVSRIRSTKKEK